MRTIDIVVKRRRQAPWTILDVEGDLDMLNAPAFRDRLTETVEQGQANIVIDLRDVPYMDSAGMGTLVGGLNRVRAHHGRIRLVATRRPVLRALTVTGLDHVFPVHRSVEEATAER